MKTRLDSVEQFKLDVRSGVISMERVRIASVLGHEPSMGFYRDYSVLNPFIGNHCEYYDLKDIFGLLPPRMCVEFGRRCCVEMLPKDIKPGKGIQLKKDAIKAAEDYLATYLCKPQTVLFINNRSIFPYTLLWKGCEYGGSYVSEHVSRMAEHISVHQALNQQWMNNALIDVVLYFDKNWKPK